VIGIAANANPRDHVLETTSLHLEGIAERCGFGTVETLRRTFGRGLKVSPSDYRARVATAAVIPIRRATS
jgi:transcriptional regulator GlxA family with amidase domain